MMTECLSREMIQEKTGGGRCDPPEAITENLLDRAARGDPEAERALYDATCRQVYDTIRSAVPDEEAVQQIMVSTYVQAFRTLRRVRRDPADSDRERARRMDALLAELPEEQSLVLAMHLYDSLPLEDIAQALWEDPQEVKKLYSEGLDALKVRMIPEHDPTTHTHPKSGTPSAPEDACERTEP